MGSEAELAPYLRLVTLSSPMSDHNAILEAKLKVIDETHRCVAGKTALIVIDMQHGFLDEGASLAVEAELVRVEARELRAVRDGHEAHARARRLGARAEPPCGCARAACAVLSCT